MASVEYLYKGLCGLARAHRANAMAGHLGAALIAGYLFSQEHRDLDVEVHAGIEHELERILRGEESLWFDPGVSGITIPELFAPMHDEPPRADPAETLAGALSTNVDALRQSGHNVIFATLAIRALRVQPRYATPTIVDGIVKLIGLFDGAGPGRGYYGRDRGWVPGSEMLHVADRALAPYTHERAMVQAAIDELISTASARRQGFGGLVHIINHAAALVDLSQLGYADLARRGFVAHRQHIGLRRSLPDVSDELGAVRPAKCDPRTPSYWRNGALRRDSAMLTHRVKVLYGFFALFPLIQDVALRGQAEESLLYVVE